MPKYPITDPQKRFKAVSEVRNVVVSFVGRLDSGELLTGVPTLSVSPATDLTFSSIAVSTAALTINGSTVSTGQAVQFAATAGTTANSPYTITVTVATDATPAQTLMGKVVMEVISD